MGAVRRLLALAGAAPAVALPAHLLLGGRVSLGGQAHDLHRCSIGAVALQAAPGAEVVSIDGQLLGHRLPFELRAQVTGGTATVSLRGATYTLSGGSRFFTTCFALGDAGQGRIPMLALSSGKDGVSKVTVDASARAPGGLGAMTDRLVGIGHAGQRWTLTVLGPPSASVSVLATETVLSGGPLETVVPPSDRAHRRHPLRYLVPTGRSLTVQGDQVVTET